MNVSNTDLYRFFPSPLAHFPDRSARWLFIDPENVKGLVELVAGHIAILLDFSQLTALNRDFLSDTLREQEADLVFSVPFRDASADQELIIHILIEHQSGVDKEMWFRFLCAFARNGGRNHVSINGRSHISTRDRARGNPRETDGTPETPTPPVSERS